MGAHAQFEALRREIAQITRNIQVLSGGYSLYSSLNDFKSASLDEDLLDSLDTRPPLDEKTLRYFRETGSATVADSTPHSSTPTPEAPEGTAPATGDDDGSTTQGH